LSGTQAARRQKEGEKQGTDTEGVPPHPEEEYKGQPTPIAQCLASPSPCWEKKGDEQRDGETVETQRQNK